MGVCGKKEPTANLQDLLIYVLKGISVVCFKNKEEDLLDNGVGQFLCKGLFATITKC